MDNVVGVFFKPGGKVYFFNQNGLIVNDGDKVIVETDKGFQLGTVLMSNIINKSVTDDMKNIVRLASKNDIQIYEKNKEEALKALNKARIIAKRLDLNMNIIEADYTFDRNQLIFYFLADSRVDFRNMARELANIYKTRIELRQIGVRDKAKEISGIGQCGRELCCSCFIKEFVDSVSINMAKNQNLALNPNKINGQCGRLLCCLNYEDEIYMENREGMPNVGAEVKTDKGIGKVVSIDVLKRSYIVNIPEEGKVEIFLDPKCDKCEKCSK